MKVRRTNDECLSCGSQVPSDIELEKYEDLKNYICGTCGNWVLRGATTRGTGNIRMPTSIPDDQRNVVVPERLDVGTWEIWWTNLESVSILHDRPVNGKRELYNFVRRIQSEYDS